MLQILSQSDKTSGEATKQLQKTLAEAMKELNIAATASAKETASAIVSHMDNIVSSCITAMSSKTGNSWDALISSLNEAFGKYEDYSERVKNFSVLPFLLKIELVFIVSFC